MSKCKVYLLEDRKFEFEEINLIAELDFMPELQGNVFIICGKYYRPSMLDYKTNSIGVRETEFETDPEEQFDSNFTCPYCKNIDHDAFELSDGDTGECGFCGSEIEYERVVSVDYRVTPVKASKIIKIN